MAGIICFHSRIRGFQKIILINIWYGLSTKGVLNSKLFPVRMKWKYHNNYCYKPEKLSLSDRMFLNVNN